MDTPRSADRASVCLGLRKDGRSQRLTLANNPAANAGNEEMAVHGGAQWSSRALPSRATLPRPAARPHRVVRGLARLGYYGAYPLPTWGGVFSHRLTEP